MENLVNVMCLVFPINKDRIAVTRINGTFLCATDVFASLSPYKCNPSIHIIYIHTYILLCMTFLHDL